MHRRLINTKRVTSFIIEKNNSLYSPTKPKFNITNLKRNNYATQRENTPYIQGSETHFGFKSVGVNEKEDRVKEVFENVADSYDIMNDFMSGGLHRYWKDRFLDASAVGSMAQIIRKQQLDTSLSKGEGRVQDKTLRILDVAGGTGDISFRFLEAAGCPEYARSSSGNDPIRITVCDINREMLRVGEERARKRYGSSLITGSKALSFVQGNAQDLKNFESDTFDLYTISFGLRNVTDIDIALAEAHRVLKPGGRFMCLEFSQMTDPLLQKLYDGYSFAVIPEMGELIANDRASYQYLVESIRKFSNQEELLKRMNDAGFQMAKFTNMTCGIVAIHEGYKPIE